MIIMILVIMITLMVNINYDSNNNENNDKNNDNGNDNNDKNQNSKNLRDNFHILNTYISCVVCVTGDQSSSAERSLQGDARSGRYHASHNGIRRSRVRIVFPFRDCRVSSSFFKVNMSVCLPVCLSVYVCVSLSMCKCLS